MDKFCGNCKFYVIGPYGAFCDCCACDAQGELVSPFEYGNECEQWEKASVMDSCELRRRMLAIVESAELNGWTHEETQRALDTLDASLEEKADSLIKANTEDEGNIACIAKEIARLSVRKTAAAKRIEMREESIKKMLADAGARKLKTPLHGLHVRRNARVEILDEKGIPDCYMREMPKQPDKKAIKEALTEGREVPGAKLVHTESLVIKG